MATIVKSPPEPHYLTLARASGRTTNQTRKVEIWRVLSGLVVIVITPAGWSLFTEPNTNDIAETFADAERRLQPEQAR